MKKQSLQQEQLILVLQMASEGKKHETIARELGLKHTNSIVQRVTTIGEWLNISNVKAGHRLTLSVCVAIRRGLIVGPPFVHVISKRTTPHDLEIMSHLIRGLDSRQIAKLVSGKCTQVCVNGRINHECKKHGLHSRTHLAAVLTIAEMRDPTLFARCR